MPEAAMQLPQTTQVLRVHRTHQLPRKHRMHREKRAAGAMFQGASKGSGNKVLPRVRVRVLGGCRAVKACARGG